MIVRSLQGTDRAAWQTLWRAYQDFYHAAPHAETMELTWRRFHDPEQPIYALGADIDGRLVGIVHYLFHLSTWTPGPYCYLQDLYTAEDARNRGVGRALIEAVYDAAKRAGASRVYWLTRETNSVAIALYDKMADRPGFVQYRKLLV
ncbi:MAG: family acetyltransferase [Bryobacterales bacterium]|nr:family acetyltransferase [Bryobacterales bacterium]